MDESIEIVGEVPADPDYKPPPEIEVIGEKSHTPRNTRKRKATQSLQEEMEIEEVEHKPLEKFKKQCMEPMIPLKNTQPMNSLRKRKSTEISGPIKTKKRQKLQNVQAKTVKNKKPANDDDDVQIIFEWDPATILSERQGLQEWQVRSVINLFDKENTLPFIARYRKENTGNLEVEKLREIQNGYSQLKTVKEKVSKVMKSDNIIKLAPQHKESLLRATTMEEVDHLTAPLKAGNKKSYAERAKELGLEEWALKIVDENHGFNFQRENLFSLINSSKEGLRTIEEIEQGVEHIIADIISKDPKVLEFVRRLTRDCNPKLECSRKKVNAKTEKKNVPNESSYNKLSNYFDYKHYAFSTKPHQILAINRGEKQNILKVKVDIPPLAHGRFFDFCHKHWWVKDPCYRTEIFRRAMDDSWERLIKPSMQRHTRSYLTESAEIASVEVFASNLKRLLLSPPLRGKTVLAIDPGFSHGCKVGVVNAQGEHMVVKTIYPFQNKNSKKIHWTQDPSARILHEIVEQHGCEYFGIGNGTACRQMEVYISNLISTGCFAPYNIQYTIINESGVSQYSITPEARSELPGMEPNHISAVSLARRLQDPLLEYVKVHPMHLGVGMYQHDIPEKLLTSSLESVMTECVSFVGVDINVASEFVLRKLSGLSKTRAANIVEYRKTKGPFKNRQQLLSVKGIGPVTFEQCAGFVKIVPETLEAQIQKVSRKKKDKDLSPCPLDQTMVHPESYDIAKKLMKLIGVNIEDIGTSTFISRIRDYTCNSTLDNMAEKCGTTFATMQLIVEGLSLSSDFDMRAQFEKPIFRKGIVSIDDLKISAQVSGTVRNVTHFGAFVDIGVGMDALIHTSGMMGRRLELGSNVEATVISVEKARGRIGLKLDRILDDS